MPADPNVPGAADEATHTETSERPLLRDERGPYVPLPEDDVVVRWIEASDATAEQLEELIELLEVAFNGGPSWFHLGVPPIDHLRWKVAAGPCDAQLRLVEEPGEPRPRLVGLSIESRKRYLINGVERVIRDATDDVLHPSVQGRGLNTKLRQMLPSRMAADPEVSFATGWGAHPTARHLRTRIPLLLPANQIIAYAKPLSLRGFLRRRPARTAQIGQSRTRDVLEGHTRRIRLSLLRDLGVATVRGAWHSLVRRSGGKPALRIETVEQFGPEVDAFFAEAGAAFDYIQIRDAAYLNWRYCDGRGGPFVVRVARDGEAMVGFAVTRADEREAVLADLLALPGRTDVAEALLDDSERLARESGSPAIRLWLQHHHPYAAAVRSRGFLNTRQTLSLAIQDWRFGTEALAPFNDPGMRLHVMLGDSDHV